MIVKIFQSEFCGNKIQYTLLYLFKLSVALRDTTEHLVEAILDHKINETTNVSMWKVQWDDEIEEKATWEPHSTFKDVEKFHLYCYAHNLERYLPSY